MGIFTKLFQSIHTKFVLWGGVSGRGAASASWNKDAYEQETVRAIVDTIATAAAMGKAKHVILDSEGRVKDIKWNSPYTKLLNQTPNSLMTGFDLKYKLVTHMETRTTALCYVEWRTSGNQVVPTAFIPIDYARFQIREIVGGGYAVEFDDWEGTRRYLNVEDVVILRKFYNSREVSGDGNGPLENTLSMIKASDEGFMEALAVSNKVRGLMKIKKAMLDPEDVKKSQQDFSDRFKSAAEKGGVVAVDSTEEYTPISVTAYTANSSQMRTVRENLFLFFRTGEEIVKNTASADARKGWLDSVIVPIWAMMGQAFTNGCFTQRELDMGNRIIFTGDLMSGSSDQTKLNLIASVKELGVLSANEIREMFGMGPIEGGDTRQVSLNYTKADEQSQYQLGAEAPADDTKESEDLEDG